MSVGDWMVSSGDSGVSTEKGDEKWLTAGYLSWLR
jgi:hypothetical protein